MGCGSSSSVSGRVSGVTQPRSANNPVPPSKSKDLDGQIPDPAPPPRLKLTLSNRALNGQVDLATSPSSNELINSAGSACGSYRDWRDVVSFPTFMTQSEKPQIFEYEFIRSIGRGAQAEVYLVQNVETKVQLAAKVYDKAFLYRNNLGDTEQPIQKTVREIQIMSTLKHPNCMGLIEVLDDDYTNSVIIILQYADAGSLLPQRSKTEPIPEPLARTYFFQIASGVCHIHMHNITHRDIKPENIMKFSDGRIAIADFSASVILDNPDGLLEDTDGTPAFYSPEQCTGKPYLAKPTDVWACGVSLYILLYGKLPFFDVTDDGFFLSQFFRIAKQIQSEEVTFDPSIDVSDEAKDLIIHCLDKNAQTRYTIEEVLKHEWLEPCYSDPDIIRIEGEYIFDRNCSSNKNTKVELNNNGKGCDFGGEIEENSSYEYDES
ncbi:CAMK family protein kinase [Tritrichomonas foetus]|uniref:CAMK family protein kinase n=1 Tax=Tritrichomonas foetus TaxID=1144522 RepID=A0A1J4JMW2_9EUKA|nr:CAMK family protein kinase [Tritrichomonas foetus]|eukprot:OHS98588.1 CAMK family protein kinase [Tritrichomonas foetus]